MNIDLDGPERQCWDCSSEQFRIQRQKGWNIAVCQNCGGWEVVENLYIPDENGKEYYDKEMHHE